MYQSAAKCANTRKGLERITGDCQCNGSHLSDLAAGKPEKGIDLYFLDGNAIQLAQGLYQTRGQQPLDNQVRARGLDGLQERLQRG